MQEHHHSTSLAPTKLDFRTAIVGNTQETQENCQYFSTSVYWGAQSVAQRMSRKIQKQKTQIKSRAPVGTSQEAPAIVPVSFNDEGMLNSIEET